MPEKLSPPKGKPVKSGNNSPSTPKVIVWAFVLSILGILLIPAVAAIIMTINGWKKVQASGRGRGLAIATLVISGFWLVVFVSAIATQSSDTSDPSPSETSEVQTTDPQPTILVPEVATEEAVVIQEEEPTETLAQSNARRQAESYLSLTAFSRKGLIEQLEFEGFSKQDATYGADAVGANWKEQAARKAQEYLNLTAFSRQSLIEQLEFEGFTSAQASYGASAVGY